VGKGRWRSCGSEKEDKAEGIRRMRERKEGWIVRERGREREKVKGGECVSISFYFYNTFFTLSLNHMGGSGEGLLAGVSPT